MSKHSFKYDNINLGHGSGGIMTRELLDELIFTAFSNPYLDKKHDGSIIDFNGRIAVSTDSFVVSPVFFKGGNIGDLSIHGTVNDVAMCGGIPRFLSLSFIVEEGLPIDEFQDIIHSIKSAAAKSGVEIITGDTKVVERGKGDKIFINTTGFGPVHPKADISADKIQAGDSIIVSGNIAQHGMAIMSEREGLQFESDILSDTTNVNYLVKQILDDFGQSIRIMRDPTRGGLASVLCEIADDTALGVELYESSLPIEKQVAAACEILGLDPLFVAGEGIFITIADAADSEQILKLMQSHEKGKFARRIGKITETHPKKVVMHSTIGGKRIVTPLIGEQLPRIC
ncbi:MAG: hydrogenase expression/formation protein HypE [Flavobacteriaceae bacterium]|nr:hydrogenase expression/formation protein HypE [Bacteroidia bacterium]NNK88312.1 hydrogenase expression/formation protein HypE [Flavobacteriaceae bacterium]